MGSMPILGSDGIGAKAAELISQHAESINEITFPRQKGGRRPQRAEGLTVCAWSDFDQLFWLRDKEDLGPLRMIVRIAEACRGPLEDICSRPRKALRRIRSLERLDRVQQMDEACLRWFVRQPGRTILQKAGPRQRVLCVIRQDTADTPENRVVHDFLRRCLRECNAYLHECASHLKNAVSRPYRVLLVLRFRSLLQSWLSRSEISRVPLPTGVPRANYVLQYDERYGQIWNWYERLRRKQLSEDEMWRWQHRTWAEHVSLSILHVLSSLQEGGPRYEGRVLLRSDPDCGRFFDSRSSVGTWIYRGNELLLVEAIQGDQLPLATTFSPELEPLLTLGCDLLIIVRSPLRRSPVRVLAIWTSLRGFGDDPNSVSVDWGRALPSTLFSPTTLRITPLLIVPRTSDGNDDQIPRQGRATYLGMTMVNIELPIPVAAHLDWLLGQLVPWLQSGSFE
ncbi:MAG: DUF2357 domain-containing protein [Planctomycetia bacterium]|nr:DUF2357 domain-containing protein [Planctomycetia bacterium]